MKKIMVALLLLAALFLNIPAMADASASSGKITVETVRCSAGDEINVKITIADNHGVCALRLTVEYDMSQLTLTSVTDGGILGASFSTNTLTSPYTLYWDNSSSSVNKTANGTAATFTFTVNEALDGVICPVTVAVKDAYDTYQFPVSFSSTNGAAEVRYASFDLNEDSKTNIVEIITYVKELSSLRNQNNNREILLRWDCDENGFIDDNDIKLLLYQLLHS